MKNYSVEENIAMKYELSILLDLDLFEKIRKNDSTKSKAEVPKGCNIEIKALEQCCQHRTHCLVYDIVGFIQVINGY